MAVGGGDIPDVSGWISPNPRCNGLRPVRYAAPDSPARPLPHGLPLCAFMLKPSSCHRLWRVPSVHLLHVLAMDNVNYHKLN